MGEMREREREKISICRLLHTGTREGREGFLSGVVETGSTDQVQVRETREMPSRPSPVVALFS